MQKCIKVKVIKPYKDDSTWEIMGKAFRDASYTSMKTVNNAVTEMLIRARQSKDEREPSKDFSRRLYKISTENNPDIACSVINSALRSATQAWSMHGKAVLSGKESLPTFKLGYPIGLSNQSYKVLYDEELKSYYIDAQINSSKQDKTRFSFIIATGSKDYSAGNILDKIINKEIKLGCAKLFNKNNKWFVVIPYEAEKKDSKIELNKDKIMGIDLGIAKAAYYGFNFCLKRGYIDGGEISKFQHRVHERRKSIQHQYSYSNRQGHGLKRALKPTDFLKHKEANFRNTTNFRYANYLVQQALRNGCGTIQMEKLENMSSDESSKFLKNWTYYDLREKIKNKAQEYDIDFIEINPKYTSQRCSICGHISKDNRKTQAEFKCVNCGYETNADYNAAVNIATKDIEKIIENKLQESIDIIN